MISLVAGSQGKLPEQKTKPLETIAWLKTPGMGAGALSVRIGVLDILVVSVKGEFEEIDIVCLATCDDQLNVSWMLMRTWIYYTNVTTGKISESSAWESGSRLRSRLPAAGGTQNTNTASDISQTVLETLPLHDFSIFKYFLFDVRLLSIN